MKYLKRQCFSILTYVLFNRSKSLLFCGLYVAASLLLELHFQWGGIFSCSGAIVTIAGMFLNIKHSLHFHLSLPKINIYHMLSGAGIWGEETINDTQEKWVDNIISDEMFGVTFMIFGTLIWAYGAYLITAINKLT